MIYLTATRAAVRQAAAAIPEAVRNDEAVMVRTGLAILGRIRRAFIVKAQGGTDEAGERWAPLSPKTVAYGRRRKASKRPSRPSQALNAAQQVRWWELYRRALAIYKGNKASAAKRAWAILKHEGATTLLEQYGGRSVEILRNTGLLLNSLSPGSGSTDQVFRVEPGQVIVGTNRKGAAAHHSGVPGRLPQRRLWPPPSKWPASWWQDIEEQVKAGAVDAAVQLIREAR